MHSDLPILNMRLNDDQAFEISHKQQICPEILPMFYIEKTCKSNQD